MARGRRLSERERALWERVAETATRLDGPPAVSCRDEAAAGPAPAAQQTPAPFPVAPFEIGSAGGDVPDRAPPPPPAAPRMDRRAFERMRRGKLAPAARLDLHGLTLARARPALSRFVTVAQARGDRLVLVITGKGRGETGAGPVPERPGVLRRQVPHWLATPPLAALVLEVTPAHPRHGGSGALYVYLRRSR